MRCGRTFVSPSKAAKNPSFCSRAFSLAVNPRWTRRAAIRPSCAQRPTCIGLVMVPKFAFTPDAMEAHRAMTVAVWATSSASSRAAATPAPKTPSVEVGCQPAP